MRISDFKLSLIGYDGISFNIETNNGFIMMSRPHKGKIRKLTSPMREVLKLFGKSIENYNNKPLPINKKFSKIELLKRFNNEVGVDIAKITLFKQVFRLGEISIEVNKNLTGFKVVGYNEEIPEGITNLNPTFRNGYRWFEFSRFGKYDKRLALSLIMDAIKVGDEKLLMRNIFKIAGKVENV